MSVPNLQALTCVSYVELHNHRFPEMDAYTAVAWEDLDKYVSPNLLVALKKARKKLRSNATTSA